MPKVCGHFDASVTVTNKTLFQGLREEPATADKDVSSDGKQDDKKPVAAISCLSVCQTYSSENCK